MVLSAESAIVASLVDDFGRHLMAAYGQWQGNDLTSIEEMVEAGHVKLDILSRISALEQRLAALEATIAKAAVYAAEDEDTMTSQALRLAALEADRLTPEEAACARNALEFAIPDGRDGSTDQEAALAKLARIAAMAAPEQVSP